MTNDLEEEAETVRDIAIACHKRGMRLEATFGKGMQRRVLHYRDPNDIPTYVWSYGTKLYLRDVHVC